MSFEKLRQLDNWVKLGYFQVDKSLIETSIQHQLMDLGIKNYKDFNLNHNLLYKEQYIHYGPLAYKELLDKYPEEFI